MDSFPNLAVDGYVAWLVMALPVCLLVGLASALLFGRGSGVADGGTGADVPRVVGGDQAGGALHALGTSDDFDGGGVGAEAAVDERAPQGIAADGQHTGLVNFPDNKGSDLAMSRLDTTRAADVRERINVLVDDPASAEELGRLYLQLGDYLLAREPMGREGVSFIQKGIAIAIKQKDPVLHGQGRMVMAAQAVEAGDLAGACEHWQLARELFLTAGHSRFSSDIGAHMHQCGCPSDWVLTEF